MKMKLAFAACFVLTAVSVHTCVRIEVLNARCGNILPEDEPGKLKEIARRSLRGLDCEIAAKRLAALSASNRGESVRDLHDLLSRPYSESEKRYIDSETLKHDLYSELRVWVGSWGLLQYLLAPSAIALALVIIRRSRSREIRAGSALLAICSFIAVILVLYRGYYTAMG